jgi:hypothetical protein
VGALSAPATASGTGNAPRLFLFLGIVLSVGVRIAQNGEVGKLNTDQGLRWRLRRDEKPKREIIEVRRVGFGVHDVT